MLDKDTLRGQIITRRTFIIGAGKFGLLFLLLGRMFYMQFIKKNDYKTLSDQNRIKMIILPPARGQIYDRNMSIIAKNNTCFRLLLDKNINPNFEDEIKIITEILELDEEQTKEINKRVKKAGRRIPAMVIDCLDWRQISVIEERAELLSALFIDTGNIRFYKYGQNLAHILGYMGKIAENEKDEFGFVDENFRIGKNGVEKFYEESLRGKFGYKQVEINAHGSYIRELSKTQSLVGNNLQLNIDAELQEKIMSYLPQQGSSAIVMDCTDGSIVGLASAPSYDPNNFNFLSNKYWADLIENPYKPLINKTIHSLYPPGSIFKMITILAALEYGIDPSHTVHCDGGPMLGGNSFRCASRQGHGSVDMHEAMKRSCNIYMYDIAASIGPQIIIDTAKKFGFGTITGIDLPAELAGFVPSLEWKKEKLKNKWSLGDTFNLAIGQGFLLCTPMQLSRFISCIATGGKLFTPKIAKVDSQFEQVYISKEHLDFLKETLYSTVNTIGGTGYSAKLNHQEIVMAGKTGTAQVIAKKNSNDDLSRENISWHRRNHAIFAGYAPHNDPKYSIMVYYDHGGGGGRAAAPIAKAILEEAFKG
jgi:penicillin-binding protein 2